MTHRGLCKTVGSQKLTKKLRHKKNTVQLTRKSG